VPGAATRSLALASSKLRLTGVYPIPSFGDVDADGIAVGSDGRLWFSEFSANGIGAVTTAGVLSQYATVAGAQPNGIAAGPSSLVWTGGYGGEMIATTTAGAQTDYTIAGAHIGDVVAGPDGNMWFTDYGNKKVGNITPAGAVTEFILPPGSNPGGMALGADGNFWITDAGRARIIKVKPDGRVARTYRTGISSGEYLEHIVAAPDGNLYFSEYAGNFSVPDKIARITTKGKIVEIGTLPPGSYPNRLTVGKDENVYFALEELQAVGKVELATGKVSYHFLPLVGATGTAALVNGPDGRLWLSSSDTIYAVSY
jgi:streptogramin lyase